MTSEAFLITADVSEGIIGADFSSASVFEVSTWEQVAHWHGYIDPLAFGYVLRDLGCYYRWATIAVETNHPGHTTHAKLVELEYPKLWTDPETMGPWRTTEKSRGKAVSALREAIRESTIKINSPHTIMELKTFVRKQNGKLEAESGCYDDCVIELAMAAYILKSCAFVPEQLELIRRQPLRELLHRVTRKHGPQKKQGIV